MQPSTTMMAICLEMIATTALLLATRIKEIAIKMGSETLATKTLMETVRLCFLSLWHVWKSIALFSGGTLSINWITESKEQVAWVTMTSNIAVTRMGEQRRILRKNELSCISFKPLFLLVILSSGIGYFLWCIVYCFVLTSQTPPPSRKEICCCGLKCGCRLASESNSCSTSSLSRRKTAGISFPH